MNRKRLYNETCAGSGDWEELAMVQAEKVAPLTPIQELDRKVELVNLKSKLYHTVALRDLSDLKMSYLELLGSLETDLPMDPEVIRRWKKKATEVREAINIQIGRHERKL